MTESVSAAASDDPVDRLLAEGPIGMTQAAKAFGTFRDGRPTHPSTVARWAVRGIRLADGRVVRLESFRLNGRLCTSRPAIVRFIRDQQDPPPPTTASAPPAPPPSPPPPTPATRRRDASAASAELDRLGIR
jgi:hypothetical protein